MDGDCASHTCASGVCATFTPTAVSTQTPTRAQTEALTRAPTASPSVGQKVVIVVGFLELEGMQVADVNEGLLTAVTGAVFEVAFEKIPISIEAVRVELKDISPGGEGAATSLPLQSPLQPPLFS